MKYLLFILLFFAPLAYPLGLLSGNCEQGGTPVTTAGMQSTTYAQVSYPGCTVTVYLSGTQTLATIYSDSIGDPSPNPLIAGPDGYFQFFAAPNNFDMLLSGAGILIPFVRSGTIGGGGGGGGGSVSSVTVSTLPSWLTGNFSNPNTTPSLSIFPTPGQLSHQVIGTCGTASSYSPCSLQPSDIPILNQSTTGNAATATALQSPPTPCSSGFYATGINASGNSIGCTAASGAGTVTNVGWGAIPSWLTGSVVSPTTTPGLVLSLTGGQTSHLVIGTCGSATTFTPCALTTADIPNTSLFVSYQFGGNTIINTAGNYIQLTFPNIFTSTQSGSGTSGAPYIDALVLASQAQSYVFIGPVSGSGVPTFRALLAGDIPTLNQSTTGNAATATALASTPTLCTTGNAPTGVLANGNATGCAAIGGGGSASPGEIHSVSFSATPTLTGTSATTGTVDTFVVAQMSANITNISLATVTPGQTVNIDVRQASSGGPYTITWGSSFVGACNISPYPGAHTISTWYISTGPVATLAAGGCNALTGPSFGPTFARSGLATPSSGFAAGTDTSLIPFQLGSDGVFRTMVKELTGIRYANGANSDDTVATAAQIVAAFSGCSGTDYLGADGSCHTPGGGGSFQFSCTAIGALISSSDTTLCTSSNTFTIASGSCVTFEGSASSPATNWTLKIKVNTTEISRPVGIGTGSFAGNTVFWKTAYCNTPGVQNAQVLVPINGNYIATGSYQLGGSMPNILTENYNTTTGLIYPVTPAAIDYSSGSHTITVTMSGTGSTAGTINYFRVY